MKFWQNLPRANDVQLLDKMMVGRATDGATLYVNFAQIRNLLLAFNSGAVSAKMISAGAILGSPTEAKIYYAGAGTYIAPTGNIVLTSNLNMLFWDLQAWSYLAIPVTLSVNAIDRENLKDFSVNSQKTDFIDLPKNRLDKSVVLKGKFVSWIDGTNQAHGSYAATDFMPVTPGLQYYCNALATTNSLFLAYYDKERVFLSGLQSGTYPITVPNNPEIKYVRITLPNNDAIINTAQFEPGSIATSFERYTMPILRRIIAGDTFLPDFYVKNSHINNQAVTEDKIADYAITPTKTSFVRLSKNLFDATIITSNFFVSWLDGNLQAENNFAASSFIVVLPNTQYYCNVPPAPGALYIAYYDVNKEFLLGVQSGTYPITVPNNAAIKYIRITVPISPAIIATVQFEKSATGSSYVSYSPILSNVSIDNNVIPNLYIENRHLKNSIIQENNLANISISTAKIIDASITETKLANASISNAKIAGGAVSSDKIAQGAIGIEKVSFAGETKNKFNKKTITRNFFVSWVTGALQAYNDFAASDFISVIPNNQYCCNVSPASGALYVAYYDANKVFLLGVQSGTYPITVPNNAAIKYIRITVQNIESIIASVQFEQGNVVTDYIGYGYVFNENLFGNFISTEIKKKWVTIGDSITYFFLWQMKVSEQLNLSPINQGVSGSTVSGGITNNTVMCSDYRIGLIPADAEIISIMGGVNDWAISAPLGDINSSDTANFYGALNRWCMQVIARFPSKRIFLVTPTYVHYNGNGFADERTNNLGLSIYSYQEAVIAVGKKFNLPVVDALLHMGVNRYNITSYSSDLVHPNQLGADRLAGVIISKMKNNL